MTNSLQNRLRFFLALLIAYTILTKGKHSLTVSTVHENEDHLDHQISLAIVLKEKKRDRNITENRDKAENEERLNQKPWLVLHVGPPKSGSTTIQSVLFKLAPQLASNDNVFYMGQPGLASRSRFQYQQTMSNGSTIEGSSLAFSPHNGYLNKTDSLYVATMKWHLQQNHSVVCSHEVLTFYLSTSGKDNYFDVYGRIFLQEGGPADRIKALEPKQEARLQNTDTKNKTQEKMDKDRIKHAFHHDDSFTFAFDVKIVVTYRHYFQWLPSNFYQHELLTRTGQYISIIEYVEAVMDQIGKEYHAEETETSGPMIDITNSTWLHHVPPYSKLGKNHGTLFSYLKWAAPLSLRDRVEIYDMHQQQIIPATNANQHKYNITNNGKPDLIRDFVCQALPNAASTCSQLHRDQKQNDPRSRARKHIQGSALETGKLSSTQFAQLIRKAKDWFPQLQKDTKEKSTSPIRTYKNVTWEDSVFVMKGNDFMFDKAEPLIRKNFESWIKQRAKRLQESDESHDSHRQLCLGEESTRKLRNVSWNMLRHLEALARLREASNDGGKTHYLFKAPVVARPQYPLLLSPGKYDHPSTEEVDWWGIKRAHDELFQKTFESGAYCELDLDRLFADEDFIIQVFYTK